MRPPKRPHDTEPADELTLLQTILDEEIVVSSTGGKHKMSKREALYRLLLDRTVKGDLSAAEVLTRAKRFNPQLQKLAHIKMLRTSKSWAPLIQGGVLTPPRSIRLQDFYAMLERGITADEWDWLLKLRQEEFSRESAQRSRALREQKASHDQSKPKP